MRHFMHSDPPTSLDLTIQVFLSRRCVLRDQELGHPIVVPIRAKLQGRDMSSSLTRGYGLPSVRYRSAPWTYMYGMEYGIGRGSMYVRS